MNGRDATAAVGGAAVGGDTALWLYDLVQWWLYAPPFDPMPDMPNTVAIGISGGLLWMILWAASWLPRRSPGVVIGSPSDTPAASSPEPSAGDRSSVRASAPSTQADAGER